MTTTAARPIRINPSNWSAALHFDQAQLRQVPAELLTIAGQCPVDESGRLLHEGDICAQLSLTMRNIETVLAAARMGWTDVTRVAIYTTDVDGTLAAYSAVVERLGGATPPATLLGVSRLAIPGMAVEIEVTAAR
jgi:enamine deaminase RidA (YjgF/YER057c/UK114 family)